MIDNFMINGLYEDMKRKAEKRVEFAVIDLPLQKQCGVEKCKKQAKRYRRNRNPVVGDLVWVCDKHLNSLLKAKYFRMGLLYIGPSHISKVLGDHTYEVANLRTDKPENQFHKQLLRPYKGEWHRIRP